MDQQSLMAVTQRGVATAEGMAALAARLRIDLEGLSVDPVVQSLLDRIVERLGFPPDDLDRMPTEERLAVLGYIRSFMSQAMDLTDHPERPTGWVYEDPAVLQSVGRSSMSIAPIIAAITPRLGDLDARLRSEGGRFLDVGTGVGWLAIALARAFPAAHIVGIDVWAPSLRIAAANVADAGARVELRHQDVRELPESGLFDGAFLAGPFLPAAIVPAAVARILAALTPGGWLLFGLYAPAQEPLSDLLTDLRVVRGGGHPWREDELADVLQDAGYADVAPVERTWPAPLRFVVGRRPE